MSNLVKKFLKLVNERDSKVEVHCGDESLAELLNYPEEREWYGKNIMPLDRKIVAFANAIIADNNFPCKTAETVADVYSNEWLIQLVNKAKAKGEEEALTE